MRYVIALLILSVPSFANAQSAKVQARFRIDKSVTSTKNIRFNYDKNNSRKSSLLWCGPEHFLKKQIVWKSAPQVYYTPVRVKGTALVCDHKTKLPVISVESNVYHLNLDLNQKALMNWPYYNYLLYSVAKLSNKEKPKKFEDWKHSPVPQSKSLYIVIPILILLWLLTKFLFILARRKAKKTKNVFNIPIPKEEEAWQKPSFSRPLSGFLLFISATILLLIPYTYIRGVLWPNDIQPFPQAEGIWNAMVEAFVVLWALFDIGLSTACMYFVPKEMREDRSKALASIQFFAWWQILSGLVQITLIVAAVYGFIPRTAYAFYAFFILVHSIIQYPGVYEEFFKVIFISLQRFDKSSIIDLLYQRVFLILAPIPFVLIFRYWGAQNPVYGEMFGAVIGLGVGMYVSHMLVFLTGIYLARKSKIPVAPFFHAGFGLKKVKEMLWYGAKDSLSVVFFRIAVTVQIVIISSYLLGYTEWLGIQGTIDKNVRFLFILLYPFFLTGVAAFSESYSNDKLKLTKYYLMRYFQYGYIYTAIVASLMLALGGRFISDAMDPQWARASYYIPLAVAIAFFYTPVWISDMLEKGAGRPGLCTFILLGEQAVSIALMIAFIQWWQFTGLLLAILLTLILKTVVAWLINAKLITSPPRQLWTMFIAPFLAGLLNYFLLALVSIVTPTMGKLGTSVLFISSGIASFFLVFFFTGLLGGFDVKALKELGDAAQMSSFLKPVARLYHTMGTLGYRLCPRKPRMAIKLAEEAEREAGELTQ